MNVTQLLHELVLIAHVAVVVALLPEDAAGNSQFRPRLAPNSGARTWATDQQRARTLRLRSGQALGHRALRTRSFLYAAAVSC